ncbi:MAG: hypothetical protein WCP34_02965 [Pseudomonadota bacterium]
MADEDKKSGGWFPYLLILLLIPGNIWYFWVGEYKKIGKAVLQEYQAGGDLVSLREKFREGGFESVQELFKVAPDLGTGMILKKTVLADETLEGEVRRAVMRLQGSGKLTALEARFLLQNLERNH